MYDINDSIMMHIINFTKRIITEKTPVSHVSIDRLFQSGTAYRSFLWIMVINSDLLHEKSSPTLGMTLPKAIPILLY